MEGLTNTKGEFQQFGSPLSLDYPALDLPTRLQQNVARKASTEAPPSQWALLRSTCKSML